MDKKYVLFGAGDAGRKLLNLLDKRKVIAFVDNNKELSGKYICGIPIEPPEYLNMISTEICVVISVFGEFQKAIVEQLHQMQIENYILPSDLLKKIEVSSDGRLKSLQGKFKGKRCFLIGTGPSLTVKDLNTLKEHNEITFASNKIFKIFAQTTWRPLLYCISDIDVFAHYYEQICSLDIPFQFLVNMKNTKYERDLDKMKLEGNNKYIFNIFKEEIFDDVNGKNIPKFSTEPDRYVVDGGITVTYSMLQWAYFLGFKDVFLLGVDFDYGDLSGNDANKMDHFCKDYMEQGEVVNYPKISESLAAYKVANDFANAHDFHIFNATRGGKLEVFKRVNFDTLFM